MTKRAVPDQIVSPLVLRHEAGEAAIVVVTHAGDKAPEDLLSSVEKALRSSGLSALRIGFSDLAPNPVAGLIKLTGEGFDVFSIVCEPDTLREPYTGLVNALNLQRNSYTKEGLCAVFWMPSWGLRPFVEHASHFLDFRNRIVEVDLDGHVLKLHAESPRFFVPPPPPPSFSTQHSEDMERLRKLLEKYDRVAVSGSTYFGWPGGPGALVRACLHQNRDSFCEAGGAYWLDGAAENWSGQLADLAPKMGVASGGRVEERLLAVAEYLQANPGALLVYNETRDPSRLRESLIEGLSPLQLGGRLVVITYRGDLNSQDFSSSQILILGESSSMQIDMAGERGERREFQFRLELRGHDSRITELAWSPDGKTIASCSRDRTIKIWDLASGKLSYEIQGRSPMWSVLWSPDSKKITSGSEDGAVELWDVASGQAIRRLEAHSDWVRGLARSPDLGSLASCSNDWSIKIWGAESGELIRQCIGHSGRVLSVSWSPDGSKLASGTGKGEIGVWDAETGRLLRKFGTNARWERSVIWSPDGNSIVSSSSNKTIRLWDPKTGRPQVLLEGHTGEITCVAFSRDGRIFASRSRDGTVRLWRCDLWEVVAIIEEPADHPVHNLAFHPTEPVLALLTQGDRRIRIVDLDFTALLGAPSAATSVKYSNAKVVLLGDTGVGKSSLSLVLTGYPFEPVESTHGRKIRLFKRSVAELDSERTETREILLWDLAGQPGYRLTHQLSLGEVTIALVVFDARNETDPFAGVRYWVRALQQAQRIQKERALPLKQFLVAARVDRGTLAVSQERIEKRMSELGFDRYFDTSAKENLHIQELHDAICGAIDWTKLPKVSSTQLFYDIRTFLLTEKGSGKLLSTVDDLYQAFLESEKKPSDPQNLRTDFETCIGMIGARGLIHRLSFGNRVLLQPEKLDTYVSAMVNAARREPDGLGYIHEKDALAGNFDVPSDERIDDSNQEALLLISTVKELLDHEIALRERSEFSFASTTYEEQPAGDSAAVPETRGDSDSILIFPSQFTRDFPWSPEPEGQAVIFEFEGAILNVYAPLMVRLWRSGLFIEQDKELYRNSGSFRARAGGCCGVWLKNIEEGRAQLRVFFIKDGNGRDASEETRAQFEEYVHTHLQRHALSLSRRRIFVCRACRTPVLDLAVRRRRELGHDTISCGVCERPIWILDHGERASAIGRSPRDSQSVAIVQMDQAADSGRDQDTAASILRGKKATEDFDVFLAHNSPDKLVVEAVAGELKKRGLYPWLASEQVPPQHWFPQVIRRKIPKIKSVAICVGPSGWGDWQAQELQDFVDQCAKENLAIVLVLLPGVGTLPKEVAFFEKTNWIRFHENTDETDILNKLEWVITGEYPLDLEDQAPLIAR